MTLIHLIYGCILGDDSDLLEKKNRDIKDKWFF